MAAYDKVHDEWEDLPSVNTPIDAAALDQIEEGIATAQDDADTANAAITAHTDDSSGAHAASAISFAAAGTVGSGTVQAAIEEVASEATAGLAAHLIDGSAAHAASAVSFEATGTVSSTNVQAAIAEVAAGAGGMTPEELAADAAFTGTFAPLAGSPAGLVAPGVNGVVGDGAADDRAAIQAIIDAVEAAGDQGGTIAFAAGVYQIGGVGLLVSNPGVHLVGSGMGELTGAPSQGGTILRAETGGGALTGNLVTISADSCSVSDMLLDGADVGLACLLVDDAVKFVANNLLIRDAGTDGIIVGNTAGSHANQFNNIYISSCVGRGIYLKANAYDTQWSNVWIGSCGGVGILMESGAQFFQNLHVWGCTSHGISIRSDANRFSNVYIETNGGSGFDIFNSNYNSIANGVLRANTARGAVINGTSDRNSLLGLKVYNNGTQGVYVVDGDYNQVIGCNMFDTQGTKTQDYGIQIDATAADTLVQGCVSQTADHTTGGWLNNGVRTKAEGNIGFGGVLAVRKTADESVTSSTTYQDDDHLTLPVEAGAVYMVDGFIQYEGTTTGDLKVQFSLPASATSSIALLAAATSGSSATAAAVSVQTGTQVAVGAVGAGTVIAGRLTGIIIVSTTAGNAVVQWAQNASDGTATILKSGSWLRLTRIS